MKVRDLISDGFYSVEVLDPANPNSPGYQRLLSTARAKKLSDYIVRSQEEGDTFLPTSVLLATEGEISFDERQNTVEIDTTVVCPFSVVDGQHRLEGLKLAAEKDKRVLDFEIPVNIATKLDKIAQMCHFLIVNTTQKSVDQSIAQSIHKRLTDIIQIENVPSLPKWISRILEKGEVNRALRYIEFLNEERSSPWYQKISMANQRTRGSFMKQHSFVVAVTRHVLHASNPLSHINDIDKEKKIFLNYWISLARILHVDKEKSSALCGYNGVQLFCKFSTPFFTRLQDKNDYMVDTMEKLLRNCFDNLEGEHIDVGHPSYWESGGRASSLNANFIQPIFNALVRALQDRGEGDIRI